MTKKNMSKQVASLMFLALLLITSSGCVMALGNRGALDHQGATLGQELIDLKAAKDAGAIDPVEYADQRKRLLEASDDLEVE